MSKVLISPIFFIEKAKRAAQKKQKPFVLWFTGLSGSGKSTLSRMCDQALFLQGYHSYILDGDNLRLELNKDLSFNDDDRKENIRRTGAVSKLMLDADLICLVASISPFIKDRELVREMFGAKEFFEVFVDVPLSECEKRDPKGLYKKSRLGLIDDFTGIGSLYEPPIKPDIHIKNYCNAPEDSVSIILKYLQNFNLIQ